MFNILYCKNLEGNHLHNDISLHLEGLYNNTSPMSQISVNFTWLNFICSWEGGRTSLIVTFCVHGGGGGFIWKHKFNCDVRFKRGVGGFGHQILKE